MSEPTQQQILAALAAQSSTSGFRTKTPPKTVLAPINVEEAKTKLASTTGESGPSVNKGKVYCFREGCGSLILSPKAADWVDLSDTVLPYDSSSPFPKPSSSSESSPAPSAAWHVPTPFTFENIGYSRPSGVTLPPHTPGLDKAPGGVKFLICAECDIGPLGWSYEGGKEAWLAVDRVRYAEE